MCVAHMHILCRLVLHGFEGHVIRTSGIKSVFSLGAMGLSSALGLNHKFLLNLGRFFFPPKNFNISKAITILCLVLGFLLVSASPVYFLRFHASLLGFFFRCFLSLIF